MFKKIQEKPIDSNPLLNSHKSHKSISQYNSNHYENSTSKRNDNYEQSNNKIQGDLKNMFSSDSIVEKSYMNTAYNKGSSSLMYFLN